MSVAHNILEYETLDAITLDVLTNQSKWVKEQVRLHIESGTWMHPDDLAYNLVTLIPALNVLIAYYGGSVDD